MARALHRLRSTLARARAELELAEADGVSVPAERLTADLGEALALLGEVEVAAFAIARVLVLDDDARLAELTARGLRRLGYEVEVASAFRSPHEGEVVVFDLSLSTSLDTASRRLLAAAHPIVLTGATDAASRRLADELGAADYLIKPTDPEDLAAAIERRREGF